MLFPRLHSSYWSSSLYPINLPLSLALWFIFSRYRGLNHRKCVHPVNSLMLTADVLVFQHSRTTCAPLYHSLLLLLFLLLPAHGAVLFVWMRNLLILIDRPRTQSQQGTSSWMQASSGLRESLFLNGEDHQIWHVFAILVIVEACSAGKTLDISSR
jgi:hypothetical protein